MEKKISCLTKIKTLYPDMTDSEKYIADYILDNPEEIYNLKIDTIAKKLSLSLPTVFRFAKKLGYDGFKDFKVDLIKEMAVGLNISIGGIEEGDLQKTTENIFQVMSKNIIETLNIIDYADLQKVIDILSSAKKIYFFGVSSSVSVAMDGYFKFIRAGYECHYNADSYTQRVLSTQTTKSDVSLGISFSGETADVVECLKQSKQNGSKTVCITTFMKSQITKYSDISLFTAPVQSLHQKIDLPSKMSMTAIIDTLYLNLVLKEREKVLRYISKSEGELKSFNDYIIKNKDFYSGD